MNTGLSFLLLLLELHTGALTTPICRSLFWFRLLWCGVNTETLPFSSYIVL